MFFHTLFVFFNHNTSSFATYAVATSPRLQQYSAVRQLIHDLKQRKPRHPKRPQLPPGEAGTPVRKIFHTAVYKQKILQYNNTLKLLENYIDELLKQTTAEHDKIITNIDSVVYKVKPPLPLNNVNLNPQCIILFRFPLKYSNSLT